MGAPVVNGGLLKCSFGVAPAAIIVAPTALVMVESQPVATIMDHKPNVNIPTFGMCSSLSNPQVQSATAAASGTLTPQPCVPVTSSPWTPGAPMTSIGGNPALTDSSTCMCNWAGTITVDLAGSLLTEVS